MDWLVLGIVRLQSLDLSPTMAQHQLQIKDLRMSDFTYDKISFEISEHRHRLRKMLPERVSRRWTTIVKKKFTVKKKKKKLNFRKLFHKSYRRIRHTVIAKSTRRKRKREIESEWCAMWYIGKWWLVLLRQLHLKYQCVKLITLRNIMRTLLFIKNNFRPHRIMTNSA